MQKETVEFKMDPETAKEIREHLGKPTDTDWAAPTGKPIPKRPAKKRPGLPTRKRKKKPWE